jgi:glycosyltransferase involved in cell wall biosynthesis
MRVALFGAYDPAYPRTRVLQEGLESRGATVLPIRAPLDALPVARQMLLALSWFRVARKLDAVLVPSFGHRDVLLAKILGRAVDSPVLFDPLVSRWDTQVGDLARLRKGSVSARRVRASDRVSLSLADMVICDTWEHGDFYSSEFGIARKKLSRIPVGADRFAFELGERRAATPRTGPLDIVYLGGYLPLHGLPAIIDAATDLMARHGPRFSTFTLIGDGMLFPRVQRDVSARGLTSVRLLPRMPYQEALTRLARADLSLGIFGTSAKAGRVVPHKVFQSMALGVPTITRRSAAIAEFFRDEEHLALVPAGDGPALARAIESLAADPVRREKIGTQGRIAARAQASPGKIGDLLIEAIQRSRDFTAPHARR